MATPAQLAAVNLDTHWIAEKNGSLAPIKKDSRLVRFFKGMASFFTRTNYYEHINRDRLFSTILQRAYAETDSTKVDDYINLAARIGREVEGRECILRKHPEMVASFNESTKCYRVPQDKTPLPPRSASDLEAQEICTTTWYEAIVGSVHTPNVQGNRKLRLMQALQSQTSYPSDANGNFWLNSVCQHVIKATIPRKKLESVEGPWKRVELPEATCKTLAGETLQMKAQVVYIKQSGKLKLNRKKQVEVILEDQKARIKSDGSVTFPNGKVLNLSLSHTNSLNMGPYTLTTNYAPFARPSDGRQ